MEKQCFKTMKNRTKNKACNDIYHCSSLQMLHLSLNDTGQFMTTVISVLLYLPLVSPLVDPYEETAPFECPGLGYFGNPDDCDIYYLCQKGSQQSFECPAGTRWDQKNQMCNWARDVPCRARLKAKDIIVDKTTGKVTCMDDKEGELPDPADCSAYYVCVAGGRGGRFQCPAKLWYDPVKHECDYKEKVDCPLFRTKPPPPTTPEPTDPVPVTFQCPSAGKTFLRDPFDCSVYHYCVDGVDEKLDCPGGFHFNIEDSKCDWPNKEKCQPRCPNRSGRVSPIYITDEFHCATYYRCQNDGTPYKYICPYPKLWDVKTKECRDYGDVDCGVRKEAKLPCDYVSTRRCLLVPNCGGKKNGAYPDDKRDCKWYYKCQDERTVMHLSCPKGQMYSYPDEKCVSMSDNKPCVMTTIEPKTSTIKASTTAKDDDEDDHEDENQKVEETDNESSSPATTVDPRDRCLGKQDGLYPDLPSECKKFFRCINQLVVRTGRCRGGTVFNKMSAACKNPTRLPPPCGSIPLFQWALQQHYMRQSAFVSGHNVTLIILSFILSLVFIFDMSCCDSLFNNV